MKKFALIPAVVLFAFCAGTKSTNPAIIASIVSPCPAEGTCAVEVMQAKELVLQQSEIGKIYYTLADNPAKAVIKYTYTKKTNPDYQDGHYIEEVLFETDANLADFEKADAKSLKMVFGVFCYCKGKAGYYRVADGAASHKDKKVVIDLPPDIVESQLSKHIEFVFN